MSTRSNEDRIGAIPTLATQQDDKLDQPTLETTGLKFITPTEFVELPSKGRFYKADHPLYNQDIVEIKHMTTREEDILTSVTLLKKGLALDRMLSSILINKKVKVDDLFLGDKNALIISARIHGYGESYDTTIKCPTCELSQEYSFDLNSLEVHFPTEDLLNIYGVEITENGTLSFPLPKTEYVIELRFLTGGDEKKILEAQSHKKKINFVGSTVSDFLKFVIISVNGVTDKRQLTDFISTLPALHARYIRKVYNKIMPGVTMEHPFACSECDYEGALEVPLTANFFWPDA